MNIQYIQYQEVRYVRRIIFLLSLTWGCTNFLHAQTPKPFTLTGSVLHSNGEVLSVSSRLVVSNDQLSWHQNITSDYELDLSFSVSNIDSQQWDEARKEGVLEYKLSGSNYTGLFLIRGINTALEVTLTLDFNNGHHDEFIFPSLNFLSPE